jgi:glyoxylase-like metal-dependent hydrolase (beta-lactamase superfamily II)
MQINERIIAFPCQEQERAGCTSYLITGPKTILVDPGLDSGFSTVIQGLKRFGLSKGDIDVVLLTHGHPTHAEASARLAGQALIGMSRQELQHRQTMGTAGQLPNPDFFLTEGGLHLGDIYLDVLRTPGHSPGHLCFYWPQMRLVLSGDLLFDNGTGRTDLPGSNPLQLKSSLQQLKNLDLEYVLPGHGRIIAGKEAVEDALRLVESG